MLNVIFPIPGEPRLYSLKSLSIGCFMVRPIADEDGKFNLRPMGSLITPTVAGR